MSDETTNKSGRTWRYVVAVLVSLLIIYALSIGPAIVLRERKVISDATVESIYAPLIWIMAKSETGEWSTPYIRAWLRLTGTTDPNPTL